MAGLTAMAWVAIGTAAVGAYSAGQANQTMQEGQLMAQEQHDQMMAYQREQDAQLEAQRQRYREFQFTNPYANLENPFEGMQNVFEDLTVSQEAARFQIEQGTQQQANIMQGLRGAAGSSGIAGLAQALAGQGRLQARQIASDIARQETTNRQLSAQGAAQLQQMERQGLSAVQMARAGGEMAIQEAEMQRQATLLGVAYQGAAGASAGLQQAYANQMSMNMMSGQMQMANAGMWMDSLGSVDWSQMNFGSGTGGNSYGTGGNPYGNDPYTWSDGSDIMAV